MLILYFIVACLIACKNEEKGNKTIPINADVISSEKVFTEEELKGKTIEELRILRNEIFAKKGYVFKDETLNDYFATKEWYKPNENVQITLNNTEKKNIEIIKIVEVKLMPFKIPKGYEAIDKIIGDIDKDCIPDIIQSVKNKDGSSELVLIYLTTKLSYQKITLISNDESDGAHPYIKLKDDTVIMEILHEGSGHFVQGFCLKYNPKIKNLQLITYTSSNRIMFGHIAKEYDVIKGNYEITKEAATIDNNKLITTVHTGKQETKLITPDLFNDQLYDYLDIIGNEFDEEQYSAYYGEYLDCRKAIIEKLTLDFEYGKLDYHLGEYRIFKKELKDFVKSIDIDQLMNADDDSYSKKYVLHRDVHLKYSKEDDSFDDIEISFDVKSNTFNITIQSYTEIKNEEPTHLSIIFQYSIEKNCTFKFSEVILAG